MHTHARLWEIISCGLMGVLLWAGSAAAQPFKGGLPQCVVSLNTCNVTLGTCAAALTEAQTDLGACTTNLGTCTAERTQAQASLAVCSAALTEAQANQTLVFRFTGSEQTFTVPSAVSQIYVETWGGGGGGGGW